MLVALIARGLPLGIALEGAPPLVPLRPVFVPGDIDEFVDLADNRLPESDDVDAVLFEQPHRMIAEPRENIGLAAGHAAIDAELVHHTGHLRVSVRVYRQTGRRG